MSGGIENMYEQEEDINRSPAHYGNDWKIGIFIREQGLGFYEGNIVKYICRYKKKEELEGLKDLIKVREYINQIIKEEIDKNGS